MITKNERSRPVGGGQCPRSTTKRVDGEPSSSSPSRSTRRPYTSAAVTGASAPIPGAPRSRAAAAVLGASIASMPAPRMNSEHWASANGWLVTAISSVSSPGARSSAKETGRIRSPASTAPGEPMISSRFSDTEPSSEFSKATTPPPAAPEATARTTSTAVGAGDSSSPSRATSSAAWCVKEPSGPRYASRPT